MKTETGTERMKSAAQQHLRLGVLLTSCAEMSPVFCRHPPRGHGLSLQAVGDSLDDGVREPRRH